MILSSSSPFGMSIVDRSFWESLWPKISFQFEKTPNSLLIFDKFGEVIQNHRLHHSQNLNEVRQSEVNPHKLIATNKPVFSQHSVEFSQVTNHRSAKIPVGIESLFKSPLAICYISIFDVILLHVFENTQSCV